MTAIPYVYVSVTAQVCMYMYMYMYMPTCMNVHVHVHIFNDGNFHDFSIIKKKLPWWYQTCIMYTYTYMYMYLDHETKFDNAQPVVLHVLLYTYT